MARRKEVNNEPSTFRVMVTEFPYNHITVDFTTKEEALQYAHELTSENTAWYGVYELNPRCEYLISVEHKRLRPHDDDVVVAKRKEREPVEQKRKAQRKVRRKQ